MATLTPTTPKPAVRPNRRRLLLLVALVVAVIVVGWLLVSRGGSSASGARTHRHAALAAGKHGGKPGAHARRRRHAHAAASTPRPPSSTRLYASAILPVLLQSAAAFDQIAGGASAASGDLGQLGAACTSGSDRIGIIESQYDGVPHPWPFYTRNGWLHHQIAATYHFMLGALTNCTTASGSGDSGAASSSLSDMTLAAGQMHHWVSYVQWLAAHG